MTAKFDIWQPRWHDRVVLLAKFRVKERNEITFSKAPTLKGKYVLSGEQIRKYPIDSNGKIDCYAVSLDEFESKVSKDQVGLDDIIEIPQFEGTAEKLNQIRLGEL